ncbi:MAG: hypothetical protein ACYC7E_23285 [Armatimonadota bacterium]
MRTFLLLAIALLLAGPAVLAAPTQTFHLKDYLGHTWSDELISYKLDDALRSAKSLRVVDETGAALPYQIADGRIYLLVTLPADTQKTITVTAGAAAKPDSFVRVSESGKSLTVDSGKMAVRLPAGGRTFAQPVDPKDVPGPLQGVRGTQGEWIGRSWLQAPLKVTGYATAVTARGPLFADVAITYSFEDGKSYRFALRAIAGQPTVIIDETMNLNPGGKYAMLSYTNDADRSTWEWWSLDDSEHLGVGKTGHQHPANAVFSFYSGLQPNQCRWVAGRSTHPRKGVNAIGAQSMEVEAGEAYAALNYDQDEQFNRLTGWWLNSFSDRSYAFTMFNDAAKDGTAVSLIMGRPSRNVNPNLSPTPEPWLKMVTGLNDMRILVRQSKDLQVYAPICLGSREWMLSVAPQSAFPEKGKEMPYTYRELLKYSYFPLEKIKDWVFDWPEPQKAWPRLFCPAGELATMQSRVAAAGKVVALHPNIPAIYRPNGTAEAMVKQALPALKGWVNTALDGRGHGSANWFHASLHMMTAMQLWDGAMATPGIDPATRAKIKAYGAFIAQRAWDEDYWPPKETANGWGSVNMGTLASTARVLSACAMAGHPRAAAWLQRCRGYLDGNLNPLQYPDGSNVSCPHYMGASMEPILYMALALKFGGGYDAFKEDARLAKAGQFMMDILTPPDPRSPVNGPYYGLPMGSKIDPQARNRRNMWPLGHTSRTEGTSIVSLLSLGYAGVDEQLAGALRKVAEDMGSLGGGAFVPTALLSNNTSTPVEPTFDSRWYPYYGAILRDKQPAESWFAIRYSKYAYDHFQADMGAFTWFAKGVPLMMDFGVMYSPENGQPIYHNRVTWDIREGEQRPCPGEGKEGCFYRGLTYFKHQFEPWTCKAETFGEGQSPTDAGGEITAFSTLPGADYLLGETEVRTLQTLPYFPDTPQALAPDPNQKRVLENIRPFTWQRRVLFAKARKADDPQYLLVRDDFTGPCPPPTNSFWVMADSLTFAGSQAHAVGQFGVDLDIYVAQPAAPRFSQGQWEHKNWGGEKQLCLRVTQAEGKPFLTLLYPRRPDEPAPAFTTIAGGDGVKISLPGSVDYAFLAPKPVTFNEGDIHFTGTAGYFRVIGADIYGTLSAGGTVRVKNLTLTSPKAATFQIVGGHATIQVEGK